MPGFSPPPTSPWQRTRYLTTGACALVAFAGLVALAGGHVIHGALLMLAALVLVPGSVVGRRSRRHPASIEAASFGPAAVPVRAASRSDVKVPEAA